MKLSVGLANGRILVYEGTYEELVQVGEKLVREIGSEIIDVKEAEKLGGQQIHMSANGNSRRWTNHNVKKLLGLLYGEQLKLVKFLAERGSATYQELKNHMGYGGQHLSGILSPVTRNVQTATGDRSARVVDWRPDGSGARRIYFVDPEALPLLKEELSKSA